MNVNRLFRKAIGWLASLAIGCTLYSAIGQGLSHDGKYVRVTRSLEFVKGGRETGELFISSVAKKSAKFKMTVSWDRLADDDGSSATVGAIDEGEIILSENGKGQYISVNKEDKNLGTCKIIFQFVGDTVVVTQLSPCWWFGAHINVSGLYMKAPSDEVIIVR
jgi:hypothetical protein